LTHLSIKTLLKDFSEAEPRCEAGQRQNASSGVK
jgi:hypothetical protein